MRRQGQGQRRRAAAAEQGPAPGRRASTPSPTRPAAAALHRGHAAGRDGVGRRGDRGRGAARGDEGHRPGHAGDARRDHRDAAAAQVHRPRRQAGRPHADGASALIERLPVPTLASPELTGAWEARLARIARGQETTRPRSWPTSPATSGRSRPRSVTVGAPPPAPAAATARPRHRPRGPRRRLLHRRPRPPWPVRAVNREVDDRQARLGMLTLARGLFVRDLVRDRRQAHHRRPASRSGREGKDAQGQVAAARGRARWPGAWCWTRARLARAAPRTFSRPEAL